MFCATFGVEGPLGPVVLVQVHPLLLAQLAYTVVKLPGYVDVSSRDGPGDALGSKEPVDLRGGGEDTVAGPGPQHQPHVRLRQVEVAGGEVHGGVGSGVRQQALEVREERGAGNTPDVMENMKQLPAEVFYRALHCFL